VVAGVSWYYGIAEVIGAAEVVALDDVSCGVMVIQPGKRITIESRNIIIVLVIVVFILFIIITY
jgi:hypothetical protein